MKVGTADSADSGFTEIIYRYYKYCDLKKLQKFSKLFQKLLGYLFGEFLFYFTSFLFLNPNHNHSSTGKNISSWTNFLSIFPHGKGNGSHGNCIVLNFSGLAAYKRGFKSQKVIFKLLYVNICFYSQLFKDFRAKTNRIHSTIVLASGLLSNGQKWCGLA